MNVRVDCLKDKKIRSVYRKNERSSIMLKWALTVLNHDIRFSLLEETPELFQFNNFLYKKMTYTIKANQSRTRIRNRCLLSGRSRGCSRIFRMTRMSLLEDFKETQKFPGLTRNIKK